jgi:PAS domain S-box-containing protein
MDLEVYPDAIIIINAFNDIIGWNRKAEGIFGYVDSEIIGRNISILFDIDVEKIHTSLYEKSSQILIVKNRNGDDLIVEISCNEFNNAGKTIISVKDVTKSQKVIEKLLLEYEKTSKIAKNKNGFIAAYSNDLKNPIHSIISFSQGMIDGVCGQINEKQEKYISIINKNANNLLTLLENMIILSKIEADQVQLEYKVFDITELVESVKNDISHLIQEKNISFDIDFSALERKNIYSDESILRQIILNLCTNAVKFTDIGQIKIVITHPDMETVKNAGLQPIHYFTDKSYILFSVSDTGIGISEEDQQIIFDEYNQSGKTMTKKYGGTGLGLAITKKLTTILGGNIWAKSKFSQGSTFSFIIPTERILTPLIPQVEK